MKEVQRLFVLVSIMAIIALMVTALAITVLYTASFEQQRLRLIETAQSYARLIESVARFNKSLQEKWHLHTGNPAEATLAQIIESHRNFKGFGQTGEFTLARREGEQIVFLMSHRHYDLAEPRPVPFDSELAAPMRLALSGKAGSIVGLDYRGEKVLAAYEPVDILDLGIVAKIDLVEIREPFLQASLIALGFGFVIVFTGSLLFITITNPMLSRIRESEERFRSIFEHAAIGIAQVGRDGRWLRVNRSFCAMVGYSEDELFNLTFQDITHPDDLEKDLTSVRRMLNGEIDTYSMKKRYIHKDRSILWINLTVGIVRGPDGAPQYFVSMIEDISREKKMHEDLEAERGLLSTLVNSIPGIFAMFAQDGRFVRWNRNMATVTGYSHDEIAAMSALDLFTGEDRQHISASISQVFTEGNGDAEGYLTTANGSRIPFMFTGQRIEYEQKRFVIGVGVDISEQKRAETALARQARELAVRNRIGEIFLTVRDDQLFTEVLSAILDVMESRYGVFGYLNEDGDLVVPTMTRDIWDQCEVPEKDIVFPKDRWGCSSWPRAIREKKPNYANERSTLTPKGHIPIDRYISLPIVHHGESIGLIQVANKESDYTQEDLRLLMTIGDAIAPVLKGRLLYDREERTRREAEIALRKSEASLQEAQIIAGIGNWEWDVETDRHAWSEEVYRIYGRDTSLPPASYPEVQHYFTKESWAQLATAVERSLAEGQAYQCDAEVVRPDTTHRWITARGKAITGDDGKVVRLYGTIQDITERKTYENHLQWNLRRNGLLSQAAARLLQGGDPQVLIEDLCHQVMAFIDCQVFFHFLADPLEDKLHLNACAGIPEHEAKKIEWFEYGSAVCGWVAQERQPLVYENILTCDDPLTAMVKSYGVQAYCCHPMMIEDRLIGTLSFGRLSSPSFERQEIDLMSSVTNLAAIAMNRIETENRLRESETRFRLFADLAPVGIVISDQDGKTLYTNATFTDLWGYTIEDMPFVWQWWEQACPDQEVRSQVQQGWSGAGAAMGVSRSEIKPKDYPVMCKDGTLRQVELRMASTGTLEIIVFADVTERKSMEAEHAKLQAQFVQAQKMESVGRLAGGVAHDYNNMLSIILGYAEMLKDRFNPSDPSYEELEEIYQAAVRSSEITRQLLAFARQQTIAPVSLDLNLTVEGMLKMLQRLIGEDIDLIWRPKNGLWPVRLDPSQVDQLLANLCVNSRDAIKDTGKITVETGNATFDARYCASHPDFFPGDYVLLAVSDDGCGMDKETIQQIFEPFFTTKDVGRGTGLGLATVYGIVKQNGGFINVYSEPGQGTTFKIYFARHHEGQTVTPKQQSTSIPHGQGETILIVEDDGAILRLVKRMLQSLGYEVISAENPLEALLLSEKIEMTIDLLLTDVIMPEMNGKELARRLEERWPGLLTLFMSGYTANTIAHHGVLDEGVSFLQKPFSQETLAMKVREVLEQKESGGVDRAGIENRKMGAMVVRTEKK